MFSQASVSPLTWHFLWPMVNSLLDKVLYILWGFCIVPYMSFPVPPDNCDVKFRFFNQCFLLLMMRLFLDNTKATQMTQQFLTFQIPQLLHLWFCVYTMKDGKVWEFIYKLLHFIYSLYKILHCLEASFLNLPSVNYFCCFRCNSVPNDCFIRYALDYWEHYQIQPLLTTNAIIFSLQVFLLYLKQGKH